MSYRWPGNVRELKSAFEYAVVACQDSLIRPENLPPAMLSRDIARQEIFAGPEPPDLEEIKKRRLIQALHQSDGNQSEAARLLGISRTSVWSQMKRFDLKG